MGKSSETFLQIREDFERDAQKDQVYLLEQLAEAEKAELYTPLPGEATVVMGEHPKTKHNERPIDADYTLPF
jgi:hypothetical protein